MSRLALIYCFMVIISIDTFTKGTIVASDEV